MACITPLGWINDDAEHAIRSSLDVDGNNTIMDMIGIGPAVAHDLKNLHNIFTINDLVGYVLYNGFPNDARIGDDTKFVLSLRCALKLMPDLETSQPRSVRRTASDPLCQART